MLPTADDVSVLGVVVPKWKPLFPGVRAEAELVLLAHSLKVSHQIVY